MTSCTGLPSKASVWPSWPPREYPLASVRARHGDLCSIKIMWSVTPLRAGLGGAADGCNRYPHWKFLQISERPLVLFWTLSPNMLNDTGFQRDGQLQWRKWQDILPLDGLSCMSVLALSWQMVKGTIEVVMNWYTYFVCLGLLLVWA